MAATTIMTIIATDTAVLIAVRVFLFNQVTRPATYAVKCVAYCAYIDALRCNGDDGAVLNISGRNAGRRGPRTFRNGSPEMFDPVCSIPSRAHLLPV